MAFENIGIGGVLRFDSRGATSDMNVASRAFNNVRVAADKLGQSVGRIRSGFNALNPGSGLIALAGGLSIAGLVSQGIEFNKQMQSGKLAIATILSVAKNTALEDQYDAAATALNKLVVIAAEAPGETTDLVGIFQQLVGPMAAANADMENMLQNTKATAILAGLLKRSFQDTGAAMSKLQAGQLEIGNDIIMMLKSMGLLPESAKEWREMLPEKRLQRMNEILARFASSGQAVGQTFDAQLSTVKSIGKVILGAFTEKLFTAINKHLGVMAKHFYDNEKAIMATARALGDDFGAAAEFVAEQAMETGRFLYSMFTALRARVYEASDALNGLGLTIDKQVLGKLVFIATSVAALSVVASPFLAIFGMIAARIGAVISIVQGLGGIITTVIGVAGWPLLAVIAAIGAAFYFLREDGESAGETIARAFGMAKSAALSLWETFGPGLTVIAGAMLRLGQVVIGVIEQMKPYIQRIVGMVVSTISSLMPVLGKIFNTVAGIIAKIIDVVGKLLPKIMAVVMPIVEVFAKVWLKAQGAMLKIISALMPVFDLIAHILITVIAPVLGWIIDIVGPVIVVAFEALGAVIGFVADVIGWIADKLGWVAELVGGALKWAWDAQMAVLNAIGGVIDKYIIQPVKYLIGLLGDLVDFVGGAIEAVADKVGGAVTSAVDAAGAAVGKVGDAASYVGGAIASLWSEEEANVGLTALMSKWTVSADETKAALDGLTATLMTMRNVAISAYDALTNTATAALRAIVGPTVEPQVNQTNITDKKQDVNVKVDVNNKTDLCIDGRKVAGATARHETEIKERSGYGDTPWQARRVQVSGVRPTR